MTREKAVSILLGHNEPSRRHVVEMYASSFISYLEAQRNITENGAISLHPRTGVPFENPYIKIRTAAMNDMNKCGGLKGLSELWEAAGL